MNKKVLIIVVSILVVLGIIGGVILFGNDNDTTLNMIEKRWINNNKKELQDISIYTEIPIFSYTSNGIVFDYLNSLEKTTGFEFNKISYNQASNIKTDYAFMKVSEVTNSDILMYTDNYVLVTKNNKLYNSPEEIKNISVGVLNDTMDTVNKYLFGSDVTYKTFSDYKAIFAAIGTEIDGAIVPKIESLAAIVADKDLTINYNIDEYKIYYVLRLGSNSTLNSILTKYYKKWSNENFDKSFNENLLENYFAINNDESQSIAKLRSKRYIYGFVPNAPYDMLEDGKLKGINDEIISKISEVTGVTIEFKKFDDFNALMNAFNTNSIDFFFNTNVEKEYSLDVYKTLSPFDEKLVILTNKKNNIVVNSVNSLNEETIGVVKDSLVKDYLEQYTSNIKEYSSIDKLMKDNKLSVKAIDNYNYEYYINKNINNYRNSYSISLGNDYNYIVRDISDNKDFTNFLNFYLSFVNVEYFINSGIDNALRINLTFNKMAYILISILILALICLGVYAFNKRTKKKSRKNVLSKEDKLKYIDMLTSLKNRNYLNDNIELWDASEVYPQTIIVVDLNNIAYINDNYGHAEGDEVIKEAANVLIKNQYPNSEIIRTNGNEFLIYLVSYDEKQIISYIKKLNKEFKELSHGFGCAIGYSIINDAIKTIDDAINEATIDMKNNKEELSKE